MNYSKKYGYSPDTNGVDAALQLISKGVADITCKEVFLKCFSLMDLTSLNNDDTPSSVSRFVNKLSSYREKYPAYPLPASVCVFSNLISTVVNERPDPQLHATAVSACFPTSQSFIEVKCLEAEMAVKAGADEVDVVLALNSFLDGDKQKAFDELVSIRKAVDQASSGRRIILKVILETGLLASLENIAEASFLAMEAGADFIKTSTGKVKVNATPAAAYVMCQCIAKYYEHTGRRVGFKPAGGISTAEDAVCYYSIVSTVLGKEWLDKSLFRLGVSRLANSLLSSIEHKTVSLF